LGLLGFLRSSAGPVLVLPQARDDWRGSGGRRWDQAIEHRGAGLNGRAPVVEVQRTQAAEFFAAAGCLFLTFAFPGFVWRYLRRGGGEPS
jgi:hypothetical protein